METKANYVAVGAFVLACVIGLVVTVLWLAGVQYSQEYAYYQAYFKGAGHRPGQGTVTRYNGIECGRIHELKFDPADPQRVIVTMQVQPNLNIREDSTASIESQGLTGGTLSKSAAAPPEPRCWWPGAASDTGDPHQAVHLRPVGAVRPRSGGQAQCRGLAPQRPAQ